MNTLARTFRGLTLRGKLIAIMLSVIGISVVLIGTGLLLREYREFQRRTEQRLTLLADVVGLNSTAALAFNDPVAAAEILAALQSDGHVMAGALYDAREHLFARYLRPDVEQSLPELAPHARGPTFTSDTATLVRAITLKGQPIGKVYLLADTGEWSSTLLGFGGIVALLSMAVLVVGLVVSSWLQRIVSDPVIDLAELMRRVGSERNFQLRAAKQSDDELGVLADGFNDMLDEIGKGRTEIEHGRDELHKLNEELEQRVLDRTAQLETANKELEAFSYSVSHDLRAPLRAIDGFSRILLDEHGATLNADGRDCLDRIRRGAQRMGLLIDDLLKLARVSRAEPSRENVNMGAIAQEVADLLRHQDPARNVQLVVAPTLNVHADPRLLRIMLENLLGNAWKFTGHRNDARVEVLTETRDGAPVYVVRDNGAGFDMNYAGKLFAPFQRLHSTDDFPGTGIGLATVQRIVRKHGGRIWADSAVNQGAAFYFTLA